MTCTCVMTDPQGECKQSVETREAKGWRHIVLGTPSPPAVSQRAGSHTPILLSIVVAPRASQMRTGSAVLATTCCGTLARASHRTLVVTAVSRTRTHARNQIMDSSSP